MRKIGEAIIGLITIIIILSIFSNYSYFTEASPLTEVTLSLQPEPPVVDVSPGSSGIVSAVGTVHCEKWGPDQVKVFLLGNSTCGEANVNPPDMVFGGNSGAEETRTFAVTTRIPQETSCYETPSITVMGYYVQGGMQYNIDPVSINIVVLQYYKIDVFFDDGGSRTKNHTTIGSGEGLDLEFDVHNIGNGNDKFELDFRNRDELESLGFSLPNPETLSIPEKRSERVKWNIGTSEDMLGRHKMEISIISSGSEESGGRINLISYFYLKIEEKTVADRIGAVLLSPLVIILLVIITFVIIVVWYKRRE